MGIQKDVLVWSSADLSSVPTVGSTFTVTGPPDLMAFTDDEAVQVPGDFDPAVPSTIEPNQTLSGTLDGVEFTGNNATTDVFEFEFAFQVTDGTNTFNIYQIDNDQFGGTTVAYVSEVALNPGATYTVLQFDDGVNFDNGTGYETTPVWDDLAGQVTAPVGMTSLVPDLSMTTTALMATTVTVMSYWAKAAVTPSPQVLGTILSMAITSMISPQAPRSTSRKVSSAM